MTDGNPVRADGSHLAGRSVAGADLDAVEENEALVDAVVPQFGLMPASTLHQVRRAMRTVPLRIGVEDGSLQRSVRIDEEGERKLALDQVIAPRQRTADWIEIEVDDGAHRNQVLQASARANDNATVRRAELECRRKTTGRLHHGIRYSVVAVVGCVECSSVDVGLAYD